jgi:hypothetical protein
MKDPNPNPTGPKTYGSYETGSGTLLEDSDGVLNMIEDKVKGSDPGVHVPDGEGEPCSISR